MESICLHHCLFLGSLGTCNCSSSNGSQFIFNKIESCSWLWASRLSRIRFCLLSANRTSFLSCQTSRSLAVTIIAFATSGRITQHHVISAPVKYTAPLGLLFQDINGSGRTWVAIDDGDCYQFKPGNNTKDCKRFALPTLVAQPSSRAFHADTAIYDITPTAIGVVEFNLSSADEQKLTLEYLAMDSHPPRCHKHVKLEQSLKVSHNSAQYKTKGS